MLTGRSAAARSFGYDSAKIWVLSAAAYSVGCRSCRSDQQLDRQGRRLHVAMGSRLGLRPLIVLLDHAFEYRWEGSGMRCCCSKSAGPGKMRYLVTQGRPLVLRRTDRNYRQI